MEWVRTDDLQWVRMTGTTKGDCVEVRATSPDTYIVVSGEIDLRDYTEEEIANVINGYGYKSIADVKVQYSNAWAQIVIECLFEQTDTIELTAFGEFKTETEAELYVLQYITVYR